ncbi:MAG: TIGR01841 family phasin [Pseudomonadota bacterium]
MADDNPMNSFFNMFKDFGDGLNLPTAQVDDVLDHHRKNLQALQDAAQVASAGGQAMMNKQREALEATLSNITEMVQDASSSASDPSKMMGEPMNLAARSFEMTVTHASEMSQIAQESGAEAFNILKNRVEEGFSELTSGAVGKK